MKRIYQRPRTTVVNVNLEGLCLRASGGMIGNSTPDDPIMGTDDPNNDMWDL